MKRLLVLFSLLLVLLPSFVLAAGTCTVVYTNPSRSIILATVSCTADVAAATYPDTTLALGTGWIFLAETNPGTTAPTNAYDIVINNSNGVDVMGGALANRDGAAPGSGTTQRTTPAVSGWVDGPLTMVTSNNAVNSATFTLKLWAYKAE
jgi:hypothetical protein